MNPNTPMSLATASYGSRDEAVEDFGSVWSARYGGEFHHTSIAVVTGCPVGELRVERYNSTAKHLVWGGALLGGALFLLAPPAGIRMLAAVGPSGAGAIVSHLRDNTDPADLEGVADRLDEGTSGLVVVAVNRRGEDMTRLLTHAQRSSSVDLPWGDLAEELGRDFTRPVLVAS
jgi:hypothetical protein